MQIRSITISLALLLSQVWLAESQVWSAEALGWIKALLCFIPFIDSFLPFCSTPESLFEQVTKLVASDGAGGDFFGSRVAVSGDTIVVGARGDDNGNGPSSGSAYVYRRNSSGSFEQVAKLVASDAAAYDTFGVSVAISGDTIVVGAYLDGDNSGSAYVFQNNGSGSFSQVAKLVDSDGGPDEFFGLRVSVSDDTILVCGGRFDDIIGYSGSVFIYQRMGSGSFEQVAKLVSSGGVPVDRFGSSVAMSDDTIVVGARHDGVDASESGSAYVFQRNGSDSFEQVAKLVASDGAEFDHFGGSVAVSGDTIVVGARFDDGSSGYSGSAYIYKSIGLGSFEQVAKLVVSDSFGPQEFESGTRVSVAMSGDTIVIGARYDDDNESKSGSAYVYKSNGLGSFEQVAKLVASDGAEFDQFGRSVAMSGDTIVVGAWLDDDDGLSSGSAYVFQKM